MEQSPSVHRDNSSDITVSFELALSCDIRIAGASASFGWPEMTLGAYPGGGAAVMLPRIVGIARAKEMLFTARRLSGGEALACGLVERLADDADLAACALQVASATHAIPAELMGAMKHALGESADLPWAQACSPCSPASASRGSWPEFFYCQSPKIVV